MPAVCTAETNERGTACEKVLAFLSNSITKNQIVSFSVPRNVLNLELL